MSPKTGNPCGKGAEYLPNRLDKQPRCSLSPTLLSLCGSHAHGSLSQLLIAKLGFLIDCYIYLQFSAPL